MIDAKLAMKATVDLARENGMSYMRGHRSELSFAHLENMLIEMTTTGMSDDKINRWLGWAQCMVVAAGCATLEDMKLINRAS